MGKIASVSQDSFSNLVLNNSKPVLVEFWAEWCGPCRMLEPVIEQIQDEFASKLEVYKLNVDHNQGIAAKHTVMSIPTLFLFKNGEIVERITGFVPKPRIVQAIQKSL